MRPDGLGDVLPSDRLKKTLSGRIIFVVEGCRRLPERINRCPVNGATTTGSRQFHDFCRSSRQRSFFPP